jgi:hypothetical protein
MTQRKSVVPQTAGDVIMDMENDVRDVMRAARLLVSIGAGKVSLPSEELVFIGEALERGS